MYREGERMGEGGSKRIGQGGRVRGREREDGAGRGLGKEGQEEKKPHS